MYAEISARIGLVEENRKIPQNSRFKNPRPEKMFTWRGPRGREAWRRSFRTSCRSRRRLGEVALGTDWHR